MRQPTCFAVFLMVAAQWSCFDAGTAQGQPPGPPFPGVIFRDVPSTTYFLDAGTAQSFALHGTADVFRAIGSLRLDSAMAWSIAEDAWTKHLHNKKLYVRTYFTRKILNRDYRRVLNPDQETRWQEEEGRMKQRVEELYSEVLDTGHVHDELNWLLVHVFAQRLADKSAFLEELTPEASAGYPLKPQQIAHIWLTDRPGGSLLVSADEGVPLNEDWPMLLRQPAFDEVRAEFEKLRDEILAGREAGRETSYAYSRKLIEACENIQDKFGEVCSSRLGEPGGPGPDEYATAVGFLRRLRFQVLRFVKTDKLHQDYRFRGDRVPELVDHMGAAGLYFAPPKAGDDGTYRYLFMALRDMYSEGKSREEAMAR